MDQLEAYDFSSEDFTNHPQRALGYPNQGQSMRRDLSNGSHSSSGTYSSISPTSPVTPVSMSTYYTYGNTGVDQYADCGEYSEGYWPENDVLPSPYYGLPQDTSYDFYHSTDPMETYEEDM